MLHVTLGGKRLCWVSESGIGFYKEDISGNDSSEVLDRVREIAEVTREYMSALEHSPPLKANELEAGYRVLSEFNSIVLAGKATRYGAQFVTWEWAGERTSLWQGHYYGPAGGTAAYAAAKQDFAVRSGLLPSSALFTGEQLTEIYRSIHETLDGDGSLTDERRKALESAARQIEEGVPDLAERVGLSSRKELELARELEATDTPTEGGMEFH